MGLSQQCCPLGPQAPTLVSTSHCFVAVQDPGLKRLFFPYLWSRAFASTPALGSVDVCLVPGCRSFLCPSPSGLQLLLYKRRVSERRWGFVPVLHQGGFSLISLPIPNFSCELVEATGKKLVRNR